MANEYKGLLDTIQSSADGTSTTADSDLVSETGTLNGLDATTNSKLTDLTNKQNDIAAALASWNALIADVTN